MFIATPHFKDSATSKAQLLGIIQYVQSAEKVPHASCDIQEASLDALIASSRQFEELKLSCRILSVYEQFEMYYASLIKLNKRRVQVCASTNLLACGKLTLDLVPPDGYEKARNDQCSS